MNVNQDQMSSKSIQITSWNGCQCERRFKSTGTNPWIFHTIHLHEKRKETSRFFGSILTVGSVSDMHT